MYKKLSFIPFLGVMLLLTGCFGQSATITPEENTEKTFQTDTFSINAPRDWEIIERKDFTKEIPIETQVIFRNNIKNEDFTANANITRNRLNAEKTSLDYARQIIANEKASILDYQELNRSEVDVKIGDTTEKTLLIFFEGKKSPTDTKFRAIQLYVAKGLDGYIITGLMRTNEDAGTSNAIEKMLRSFGLK